jgi:hypothetical protein
MAQTGLIGTILLGFLAYHMMSQLNDGSRMVNGAQPRPEPATKYMAAFKYNILMAFHHIKSVST